MPSSCAWRKRLRDQQLGHRTAEDVVGAVLEQILGARVECRDEAGRVDADRPGYREMGPPRRADAAAPGQRHRPGLPVVYLLCPVVIHGSIYLPSWSDARLANFA